MTCPSPFIKTRDGTLSISEDLYPLSPPCGDGTDIEVRTFDLTWSVNGADIERWLFTSWLREPKGLCEDNVLTYHGIHYLKRGNVWKIFHTESVEMMWNNSSRSFVPAVSKTCWEDTETSLNAYQSVTLDIDIYPFFETFHYCYPPKIKVNNVCVCPPDHIDVGPPLCCIEWDDDDGNNPPPPLPGPDDDPPTPPDGWSWDPIDRTFRPGNSINYLTKVCDNEPSLHFSIESRGTFPSREIRIVGVQEYLSLPQYGLPAAVRVANVRGITGALMPPYVVDWMNESVYLDVTREYYVDGLIGFTGCGGDPPPTNCGPRWISYWIAPSTQGNPYLWKATVEDYPGCDGPDMSPPTWFATPPMQVMA